MSSPCIISGIDIGNTTIKVVVAKVATGGTVPEVIGVGVVPSASGLRAGEVVDMKEVTENLRAALTQAATMAGHPIRRAYVSVNGAHIGTQVSRGVVAVARADQEISASDIDRVVQAASVVSLPPNRETVHVIPREFVIDNTEHVRDPVGMKGVRLEADALIVHGLSRHVKNLAKCANECGVQVSGFVFAPLAGSLAALDKHQKEYGVAHLDFGGGTSFLTVFDQGDMAHSAVLKIGSRHITNDLAILLRTSIENAERIKIDLGAVNEREDRRVKPKMAELTPYMDEPFVIQRRQLVSVIDARARELLDMVRTELKAVGKNGKLPAGVVISGGGSKLPGFATLARDVLELPVRMARPMCVEASDSAMDPSLTVPIGLVVWGFKHEIGEFGRPLTDSMLSGWVSKVSVWLKNFLP